MERFKFANDTDVNNGVQALPQGDQGEPIDEAIQDARIEAAYSNENAIGNYENTNSNTYNNSAQEALQREGSYKYGIFYNKL